jgi:hypothetical protein
MAWNSPMAPRTSCKGFFRLSLVSEVAGNRATGQVNTTDTTEPRLKRNAGDSFLRLKNLGNLFLLILLKKSIYVPDRNFLASLVSLAHSDLRDCIASRTIDHGSSRVGRSSVQLLMGLDAGFGEIFEVDRFSTFSTVSARSGRWRVKINDARRRRREACHLDLRTVHFTFDRAAKPWVAVQKSFRPHSDRHVTGQSNHYEFNWLRRVASSSFCAAMTTSRRFRTCSFCIRMVM